MIKKKIGAILKNFVKNSDWYQKQFLDCDKFWGLQRFGNKVAFIGSDSGHYATNFSGINLNCLDLTLRDSTILQDYEVLRNYSSYLKENNCSIYMIISPFDFLTGSTTYFEDRYYSILNMASIPGFSYERRADVLSRRSNPILYYPLFSIRNDLFTKRSIKRNPCLTSTQYIDHIKHRYSINDFSKKMTMLNQDAFKDSYILLNKIRSFCDEHGFIFTLVFPPVTKNFATYLTEFTNNQSYSALISEIKESGIRIQDYSFDNNYSDHPELFMSELYLNHEGASLFTKQLLSNENNKFTK